MFKQMGLDDCGEYTKWENSEKFVQIVIKAPSGHVFALVTNYDYDRPTGGQCAALRHFMKRERQ